MSKATSESTDIHALGSCSDSLQPSGSNGLFTPARSHGNAGALTISPPSNVNSMDSFPPPLSSSDPVEFPFYPSLCCRVLASGIDTLNLSLNVTWESKDYFDRLNDYKEEAQKRNRKVPVALPTEDPATALHLNMHPRGVGGYNWLLSSRDFALRVLNRDVAAQRPNIMVEIKAEPLWQLGPFAACEMILSALRQAGAVIVETKPSRVDVCMDLALPAALWQAGLVNHAVTRAQKTAVHSERKKLTGISFGGGQQIMARLYDKVIEVRKAGKEWFFDVWDILEDVPAEYCIIRVEFQFRREPLKELGLISLDNIMPCLDGLWAYATKKWLKFQDYPEKHHTLQNTLPFWRLVQEGFLGVQNPTPLVRSKAIRADSEQLSAQARGVMSSLAALDLNNPDNKHSAAYSPREMLTRVAEDLLQGMSGEDFKARVEEKKARYLRPKTPASADGLERKGNHQS